MFSCFNKGWSLFDICGNDGMSLEKQEYGNRQIIGGESRNCSFSDNLCLIAYNSNSRHPIDEL